MKLFCMSSQFHGENFEGNKVTHRVVQFLIDVISQFSIDSQNFMSRQKYVNVMTSKVKLNYLMCSGWNATISIKCVAQSAFRG